MTFNDMGEIKGKVTLRGWKVKIRFRVDNFEMFLRHPKDLEMGSSYSRLGLEGKLE